MQVCRRLFAVACLLAVCASAHAQRWDLIYNQFGPLAHYGLSFEANPGAPSFPTRPDATDVQLTNLPAKGYSEVTANVRMRHVFVNAIANLKVTNTTPDGAPIRLTTYGYVYAVRLPRVPVAQLVPNNAQAVHLMIMLWDGSNRLWAANKRTVEASIYWSLNPWQKDFGDVYVYTTTADGRLQLTPTGIHLTPDTNWHTFEIRADLKRRVFTGIVIDQQWRPLTNLPLAQVYHPDWGTDLSLIFTAESMNCYPGPNASYVNSWTTQFKDVKIYRQD